MLTIIRPFRHDLYLTYYTADGPQRALGYLLLSILFRPFRMICISLMLRPMGLNGLGLVTCFCYWITLPPFRAPPFARGILSTKHDGRLDIEC